jgi:HAMP domain-containing protein
MGKFNLKDQLAGIAALIAAIVAIGGGFVKYGEITTKLDAISEPDLTPLAQTIGNVNAGMADNQTNIAVMQKEIELLKLQLEEIKVSTSNPLSQ